MHTGSVPPRSRSGKPVGRSLRAGEWDRTRAVAVTAAARASVIVLAQPLEQRVLFAFDPSAREQELLELLNRMRERPAEELPLLLNSGEEPIERALNFFDVDRDVLAAQWAQLVPAPPLAWNEDLSEAALFHNGQMLDADEQSHQVPGEPSLRERVTSAGYTPESGLGESVFAFTESIVHGHAGFAIDWGVSDTGIQDPPGHRNTMMDPSYREVGISVIDSVPQKAVGPMLITQDFGAPSNPGNAFLLGVVYDDANADGFYTAGEGIADADITITSLDGLDEVYQTSTLSAGGYQIALPGGVYHVEVTSETFDGIIAFEFVNIEDQNLKIDATADMAEDDGGGPGSVDEQPPTATLAGALGAVSGRTDGRFTVRISDPSGLETSSLDEAAVRLQGPNGVDLTLEPGAIKSSDDETSATLTYSYGAPGGFWDAADGGAYTLTLTFAADALGNTLEDVALGTFDLDLPARDTPTVTLLAGPMKLAGKKFHRVDVEYFSRNKIDVGTLSRNDVVITGPGGEELAVKFVGVNKDADGKRRVATYRITAPSGAWKPADNGRYRVGIRAHAVRDADGNHVPPGKAGSFKVNIAASKHKRKGGGKVALAVAEPATLFSNHRVRESAWHALERDVQRM